MKTNIRCNINLKMTQASKSGRVTNKLAQPFCLMIMLLTLLIPQYVSAQPGNDNCNQATTITVGTTCNYSTYTNASATYSNVSPVPGCGSYSASCADVWFKVVAPASGHLIIDAEAGGITDGAMALYSGTNCNSLTLVQCDDDDGAGNMPQLNLTGLTPGATYYLLFWEYGGGTTGTFGLCAYDGGDVDNALCDGADPFCTGTTYDFPMGVNSGSGETGPDYGCLSTTPNPIWYYLQVATAGPIELYMYGSAGDDIDFACWGPFSDATDPCTAQLTAGTTHPTHSVAGASADFPSANMVDCSYDAQDMEWCYIPNAQVGEVYLVLITNYSNTTQNVVFSQTGGTGETDCSIVAPPISNNGPLCEGQTLQLMVTSPVTGASYAWTGPNGFTSALMNPTIANVTTANAGTYTLVITVGGVSSAPVTTTVVINEWVTPGFNQIGTVCQGDPNPTLPTTSLNGVIGTWSPATVSTATLGSTTYTFTPDAGQCAYNGTMSVEVINCSVAAPCPDYANTVSSSNQHCAGQTYYFVVENTACGGFISFNVVGNWGSSYATELTWAVTSNLTGDIIIQDNNGANNANGANFNIASGAINPNVQGTVFTLTIYDSYGDGFNGTGGYIVAQQNGVNVCSQITGNFGAEAHVMFFANITISPATITITTPGGPVTQTVTNCRDFKVPVPINNSLFCTTSTITLPWVVNCETNGSILSSGNFAMTIFPNTPDDISDVVDISFDPVACAWVSNYQNDCLSSHLGSIFTITPNPNTPVDACEAHFPETFTLQYTGIPSGLACCNTAGPGVAMTYNDTIGTGDADPANTPFGGTNNAAYLTIPPNGAGGGATAITLNFDMSGYCFVHPTGAATDFWVTIFVDGQVVYDGEFFDPATTASITLDLTDIPAYDENSVIEVYVYPNTFNAGGYNTTFVPGVNCNALDDGEWTASYFNLSVDVTFSEVVPTPAACSYDANENKPCCATVTTPDAAQTICSGDPFGFAAWQNAVSVANSICLVFSSDTLSDGTSLPGNNFPDGINNTTSPIVQTAFAYAYCDMNGSGAVDAGDLYTLLSTYALTVNPSVTPTFTQLGPYCTGDSPGTLPNTSLEGVTGTWSPSSISTATANTTTYTFTPDADPCANTVTMSVTVSVCCPTITCPPDTTITACNQLLPAGATTLVDFVNLGGTISNATAVSYSDVTVNGCNTVTTRTYTASNASACTVSCTQTITRTVDTTPPTITGTLTAANVVGCSAASAPAAVITVAALEALPGAIAISDNCTGDVSLTVTSADASAGTCPIVITRTYTIKDACNNATTVTHTINVNDNVAPTITACPANQTFCSVPSNTYTIPQISASDNCTGTLTYTYTITGATSSSGSGTNASGIFNIGVSTIAWTVTDVCGNTSTCNTTVTINANPSATITGTDVQCNGGSTGSADLNVSGGTPNYNFNWSNSSSSEDLTGITSGTYSVTVTDANGCTAMTSVTISEPPALTAGSTATAILCNGSTSTVTVTATGGTGPYTGAGTFTETAGTHTYTVTDANGCTATTNITITEPAALTASITASSNQNCSTPGSATVAGSGGTGTYTYTWPAGAGGVAGGTATSLTAGSYDVTVTDVNGCSVIQNVSISDIGGLTASATVSANAQCNGDANGSVDVTITGGTANYTINWGGTPATSATTNYTMTGLTASAYTITVTDVNGCQGFTTATVTEPAVLTAGSSATIITCNEGTSTVTVTAAGGNFPYTGAGTFTETAGTYTYTITDANGCTANSSITITQDVTPPAVAITNNTGSTQLTCALTSINVTATSAGATSYAWNGGATPGTAANIFTAPGTYTVAVTAANGCTANSSITITQDITPPAVAITNNTGSNQLTCALTSINVTATPAGATSYAWSGGASPAAATNSLTAPGTYTVTVTAANGCTANSSITITQDITPPAAAIINNTGATQLTCALTPINVTAIPAGAASYAWSGGATPGTAANSFTAPGTYTVTVTAANGCKANSSITITQDITQPVITFTPMPQLCVTSPDFVLTQASPSGGTYTGPGVTGTTFNPATAGMGTHTITYSYTNPVNGCSNIATTQIIITTGLTITVTPNNPSYCAGGNVLLSASGATDFNWQPNIGLSAATGGNVIASPTSSTMYTVLGSNPDGCSGSTTVAVSVYTVPTLSIMPFPSEGCSPLNVTFSYVPAGPIDTNSLHWNFGDIASIDNTSDLINPEHIYNYEGSYTVYLSAATNDGCPVAATDTVRAYHKPIADFYFNPEAANMDDPEVGFVDISVGANAWSWNFGNPASNNLNYSLLQNPYHTYTDTGTYIVELIVSSSHNCSDTVEKPVTIYPSLVIYIPNAFTPNSDKLNDTWKPVISGIDEDNYHLYIYDRWGKVMFSTNDINQGWDGKYDEKPCPDAVYVYMIEYRTKPGNEHKTIRGGVTLIK